MDFSDDRDALPQSDFFRRVDFPAKKGIFWAALLIVKHGESRRRRPFLNTQ
jgi:hypothetical protein